MWLAPIELGSWAKAREAALVAEEDAMYRACRDRATTPEDCAFWDAVILSRERNRARAEGREPPPGT